MRRLIMVVAALALVPFAAGGDDDAKKDIERFQGTWRVESAELGGEKLPLDMLKDFRLIIEGTKFTEKFSPDQISHGTFKVDVSKKPKTVDVTFTDGPNKGKTLLGIYELDGDTYKACFDISGKERPTKFESKKDTPVVLEVLKREKK
jgi:uncharacterized protein (TIGR03067 family)